MNKLYKLLSVVLLALLIFGCEDRNDLADPSAPSTGEADFTTYVSIGNSLTAGYQNNSLYQEVQEFSYPNLIAGQVMTDFVQPLISDPGIAPGKLEVESLVFTNGSITGANFSARTDNGETLNSSYEKPFNNLGIPGAVLGDMLDNTDFAVKASARQNPYFVAVLRNAAFGSTVVEQVANQTPTFITCWIGNNDVLGYATSGGVRGSDATGMLPTEETRFSSYYAALGMALNATGAKVAVANIPNVTVLPYFMTVGPSTALNLAAYLGGEDNVALYYQKQGETTATSSASYSDLLAGRVLLTLSGSEYAAYIGDKTGAYYTAKGVAPPAGIVTTAPFGLDPQNPWPHEYTLDPDEIRIANDATSSFNGTIANVASTYDFAVVDINSEFQSIAAGGKEYNGVTFTTRFLSGYLFSLDGVHPTSQGAGIIANQFIKAINTKWNANIPEINVASLPSSIPMK